MFCRNWWMEGRELNTIETKIGFSEVHELWNRIFNKIQNGVG